MFRISNISKETILTRLKTWGRKSSLAIIDQGIFSSANFLLTILLARLLLPNDYGMYSISFSMLMLFYQIHFSFFLEPMSVIGSAHYHNSLVSYLKGQILLHFLFTFAVGIILLMLLSIFKFKFGFGSILDILIVMSLLLPFILLPWLLRRVFYVLGRVWISLLGSLLYALFLIAFIFLCFNYNLLTAIASVIILAGAGLFSSLFMLYHLGGKVSEYFEISLKEIYCSNWIFGRWLVIASFFMILSNQIPIFMSGVLLSVEDAGVIRALQVVSQPMILSITAVSALAIPFLAAEISSGKKSSFFIKAHMLTLELVLLSLIFELILILFKIPIEYILYSGKFANFVNLIPIWGILPIISAINSGFTSSLQASQKPYALLIASLIWLPASFILSYLFTLWWGLYGASLSAVVSFSIYVAVIVLLYWKWIVPAQSFTKLDN